MNTILELIGRFHPLLVHLPIGILLIAIFFYWLSRKEKYALLQPATGIALFWGMISAVLSCITGYLLSQSGEYDAQLAERHQWLGISVAVVSLLVYLFHLWENNFEKWLVPVLLMLIIVTGHLGGSLTHGSDYLTKSFSSDKNNNTAIKRKQIDDIQQAVVYKDLIKPILEARCYGCHGPNKQKGKLRLDEPDHILKGGEDGKIIIAGKPGESDLIERILLSKDDDDHMPPKEKPQLSKQDIDLLHWWVSSGADFDKKVNECVQTEQVKSVLIALQTGRSINENNLSDVPSATVSKADEQIIAALKRRGAAVFPVAMNSNYLSVNFVTVDSVTNGDLKLLEPLGKQLIWLKLSRSKIPDSAWVLISKLSSLTRLYLERTNLTDKDVEQLAALTRLQYLNLSGTKVSAQGLEKLKEIKNLKQIFIYQTGISSSEWVTLKKIFPATNIDTGGYKVPVLMSDTVELKEAVKKN